MIFCAVSRDVIIPPVVPVVNPVITVTEGLSMAHLYFCIYEFCIFCIFDAHCFTTIVTFGQRLSMYLSYF